jgi:hypothetical protein
MSGALALTGVSAVVGSSAFSTLAAQLPLPQGLQSILLRGLRKIDTIIPDVTIEENHSDRVTVTQHPIATGTPVSDHVYRLPSTVTMRLGWTNSNPVGAALGGFAAGGGFGGDIGGGLAGAGSGLLSSFDEQRVNQIYEQLRKLQFDDAAWGKGQTPVNTFQLVTGKRTYPSMIITELQIHTDRSSEYSLMVEAHFQEVMKVTSESTTQPAQTDQQNPSQTASPTDTGDKTATPPGNPNSVARSADNAWHGRPLGAEVP